VCLTINNRTNYKIKKKKLNQLPSSVRESVIVIVALNSLISQIYYNKLYK